MTAVYCFSATGHSRAVARFFAAALGTTVRDLNEAQVCDTAVVVFPVYCENIPGPVRDFLTGLDAGNVVLIATYGGMRHGNVLADAEKLVRGHVIAGAFVPTGHTYRNEGTAFRSDGLEQILPRIGSPRRAVMPRFRKHFWADLFPSLRSRIGVAIIRHPNCSSCGLCEANCPVHAIRQGRTGSRCIRCLRCVHQCPREALTFRLHPMMKRYLSRPRETGLKIFL